MVYLFTQISTDIDNYGKIIQIISKQVEIKLLWLNLYYVFDKFDIKQLSFSYFKAMNSIYLMH